MLNQFRQNPKLLAKHLEAIRTYLDRDTNVLSEPNKIQIQMVEGDIVFKEAISYLKTLSPVNPLEWDDNLAASAKEHVNDIGPKGLLLYQSSDGTEPEDRIAKYGSYVDSLGENIDFGPNDALGVIVSLTLDDGEEQRPHRDNLFKSDYKKIGIACGIHKTEFHMCVMDFATDFIPNNKLTLNNKTTTTNKMINPTYESSYNNNTLNDKNNFIPSNQSPFVKLSLDNEDFSKYELNKPKQQNKITPLVNNNKVSQQIIPSQIKEEPRYQKSNEEIEELSNRTKNLIIGQKVKEKRVEIVTKITYTYEDGTKREIIQTQKTSFK